MTWVKVVCKWIGIICWKIFSNHDIDTVAEDGYTYRKRASKNRPLIFTFRDGCEIYQCPRNKRRSVFYIR